jgi:hypothetical protein
LLGWSNRKPKACFARFGFPTKTERNSIVLLRPAFLDSALK